MCTVCGCSEEHTDQDHHAPSPEVAHHLHVGLGIAGVAVAGIEQKRLVEIEQNILGKNNQYAARNRSLFQQQNVLTLNLVSSPGSGKTTLLIETLKALAGRCKLAVIEGDQQTSNDAERIRATGVSAIQINTGKGCHLDAHMVGHALEQLQDLQQGILFIENVGNLVCPAAFDLGEQHKVVILSVTEGDDKPIKYPDMFHAADLMLINKVDLLPYVDFDLEKCMNYAKQINPDLHILQVSAKDGTGLGEWVDWLMAQRQGLLQAAINQLSSKIETLKQSL